MSGEPGAPSGGFAGVFVRRDVPRRGQICRVRDTVGDTVFANASPSPTSTARTRNPPRLRDAANPGTLASPALFAPLRRCPGRARGWRHQIHRPNPRRAPFRWTRIGRAGRGGRRSRASTDPGFGSSPESQCRTRTGDPFLTQSDVVSPTRGYFCFYNLPSTPHVATGPPEHWQPERQHNTFFGTARGGWRRPDLPGPEQASVVTNQLERPAGQDRLPGGLPLRAMLGALSRGCSSGLCRPRWGSSLETDTAGRSPTSPSDSA